MLPGMIRTILPLLLVAALTAADLTLTGTWAGPAVTPPAGATVVLAMYDRNGTCCGGPAAALAGLGNLRTSLQGRSDVCLVAIDVTAGATSEQATAAAALYRTDGIPLLVDGARATAAALNVKLEMTMTYVVRKADGTQAVVFSPSLVRKQLGS